MKGVPPQLRAWHVAVLAEPDAYRALPELVAGMATIHAGTPASGRGHGQQAGPEPGLLTR